MAVQSAVQSNSVQSTKANFLRRMLQANGAFSVITGLLLIFDSAPIASFLGGFSPTILMVIGIGLLVWAADLFWIASRHPLSEAMVKAVIGLDVAWVVGSVLLLITGWVSLTTGGMWAVGIVADIVLLFALLQFYGLRQVRKEQ